LHGEAVDFAKSGLCPKLPYDLIVKKFPDYMEKKELMKEYESQTVIGKLYRNILNIIYTKY
jgi:RNA-dependent RNA polymerase